MYDMDELTLLNPKNASTTARYNILLINFKHKTKQYSVHVLVHMCVCVCVMKWRVAHR